MKRKSFAEKVVKIVSGIPRGKTMTYGEIAKRAGSPKAARAVGNILNRCYKSCIKRDGKTIPCHRVIRLDGKIGGYAGGEKQKIKLLAKENSPARERGNH